MATCVYLSQQLAAETEIAINCVKDLIEKDAIKSRTLQFLVPSTCREDPHYHLPSISEWFVTLCRQYSLMHNPRFTVLSHADMLHIVQLGVAQKNKLEGGDFEAQNETVFQILEKIGRLKLAPTETELDKVTPASTENDEVTLISSENDEVTLISSENDEVTLISSENDEVTLISSENDEVTLISSENDEVTPTSSGSHDRSDVCVVMDYYQTSLTSSNHVDLFDVYKAVSQEMEKESDLQKDLAATIICCFGSPTTHMEKKMLHLLCPDGKTSCLEMKMNGSSDVDIDKVELLTESLTSQVTDYVYTTAQTFIYKTIVSYVHLLVNSRSELALSHIFNIPNRDLNHLAFTAVKREAKKKNMTMYQTLTSFVMKLRLGGKGYAPSKSSTLLPHVKGFSLLMGMVQKLQGIIEENPDISCACGRVISIIKNNLSQCGVCKFRKEDLDMMAEKVQSRVTTLIEENDRKSAFSPDKPASEGGSLTGRRSLRVFRQLLDWTATMSDNNPTDLHLDSIALNPNTPTRIPSLLSQFRSPVISDDSPVKKPVKEKGLKERNNLKRKTEDIVMPCGEKLRQMELNSMIVLPSKTLVSASEDTQQLLKGMCGKGRTRDDCASKDKENLCHQESAVQKRSKKARLHASSPKLAAGIVDKKINKPQTTKRKAPAKTCRRRLLPQVEGQKQITSFFRL